VDFVTNFFNPHHVASGMNDGLSGTLPTELKELTELQELHLAGTALTGSLALSIASAILTSPSMSPTA
jgi:hypothetical protein